MQKVFMTLCLLATLSAPVLAGNSGAESEEEKLLELPITKALGWDFLIRTKSEGKDDSGFQWDFLPPSDWDGMVLAG